MVLSGSIVNERWEIGCRIRIRLLADSDDINFLARLSAAHGFEDGMTHEKRLHLTHEAFDIFTLENFTDK